MPSAEWWKERCRVGVCLVAPDGRPSIDLSIGYAAAAIVRRLDISTARQLATDLLAAADAAAIYEKGHR